MASKLSRRDMNVLEKIKDPESDPSMGALIDETLPKDPNVRDRATYERVSRAERQLVLTIQQLESRLAEPKESAESDALLEYRRCVSELGDLISSQPNYASTRNNRAQALRRLYGDGMLVEAARESPQGLLQDLGADERVGAAAVALSDLEEAISLLSPRSLFAALSPLAAKTLSMAYTQRAAIYHTTSKLLGSGKLQVAPERKESSWSALEFEEASSRDFAMGGRYGNEIAKGLAVSTNPTAKLCGQMVREMMRKEYETGMI